MADIASKLHHDTIALMKKRHLRPVVSCFEVIDGLYLWSPIPLLGVATLALLTIPTLHARPPVPP